VEPRMKDSVMFTPSGEQKQGERFAAYPVMRATNPCLVLDKTDARATAPATITELNGTGGTVQFQFFLKKEVYINRERLSGCHTITPLSLS
jgi:hypothetical protein